MLLSWSYVVNPELVNRIVKFTQEICFKVPQHWTWMHPVQKTRIQNSLGALCLWLKTGCLLGKGIPGALLTGQLQWSMQKLLWIPGMRSSQYCMNHHVKRVRYIGQESYLVWFQQLWPYISSTCLNKQKNVIRSLKFDFVTCTMTFVNYVMEGLVTSLFSLFP